MGTARRETVAPNELWCMDYKGEFRLGNQKYCYPLTVTDHFSRLLVGCDALESTCGSEAEVCLWNLFSEYGLPDAVRSDNGSPFASTGRLGFSRLSVWFVRLGIAIERIEPGHPEQNGRHERMHRTLKEDATRPAAKNILGQQEKFDAFRRVFNEERPHEALNMKTPSQIYRPAERKLPAELPDPDYPFHDRTCKVGTSGHFTLPGVGQFFLGQAFALQKIGLRQLGDGTWLTSFVDIDVGYLDVETKRMFDLPQEETQ